MEKDQIVTFTYTNWHGETATRRVIPRTICFGATNWDQVPQWLLQAWDLSWQGQATFPLARISGWAAEVPA